jgi:DNA-binding MarR family transcriptional regulator
MSVQKTRSRPRLAYAVAFLERGLRRSLATALDPLNLTLAHYTVLSLLGIREGLSNAQLARRAYVTPQAMSEIVRYLEGRELVVRTPSPTHARIHPTHLTESGRTVLKKCDAAVDRLEQEMMAAAAVPEDADLVETLMGYARALETRPDRATNRGKTAPGSE